MAAFEQVFEDAMRINESGTLIERLRTIDVAAMFVTGSESGLRAAAEETAAAVDELVRTTGTRSAC